MTCSKRLWEAETDADTGIKWHTYHPNGLGTDYVACIRYCRYVWVYADRFDWGADISLKGGIGSIKCWRAARKDAEALYQQREADRNQQRQLRQLT